MVEVTALARAHFEFAALSASLVGYYERFGWERWQGASYVQDGDQVTRTADDDDGILVLRCGPSAGVDLTDSITCDIRSGDVW